MTAKVSAFIAISGDQLDFTECSKAVGLEPTRTFEREYEYDSSVVPRRQWIWATEKSEMDSIDDALLTLLAGLPSKAVIAKFAASGGYAVAVGCSVDIYKDRPLYELSGGSIAELSLLGASFSLDIHDFAED